MCQDKFERRQIKMGSGVPTIPVSTDHRNGDWIATDIYEGELYMDTNTGQTYTRSGSTIITAGKGAENFANADLTFTDNRLHALNGYNFSIRDSSLDVFIKTPTLTKILHNYGANRQQLEIGDSVFTLESLNNVELKIISNSSVLIDTIILSVPNLPTYATDALAGAAGVPTNTVYMTPTGELRIKL